MLVRAFRAGDTKDLLTWFPTARDLAQWGGPARRFPLDEAEVAGFLALTGGQEPKALMWAGEEDGRLAATAITWIDRDQGVVLLGLIAVAPSMRGRGLALPFLGEVVRNTFADARIHRIELNVYTFNTGAIRTYERLGFTKEGVRRSLARVGSERWDAAHYSMLRGEFERAAAGLPAGGRK